MVPVLAFKIVVSVLHFSLEKQKLLSNCRSNELLIMKAHTRLAGKYVRKLCCLTGRVYEGYVNIFITNNKSLQFSRRGFSTLPSTIFYNTLSRKPPWRVLFFGTDDFSLASLKMLFRELEDGGLVKQLAVVTSLKTKKNPVRDFAVETELSTFSWPCHAFPGDFDVGLVSSFGHLLPECVIESFPLGMLNVHASLLPRWRGAAPIIYAILNGDSETGVTIMQIKPRKFDIGNIVLQERCPIAPTDTAPVLKERLAELGSKLLQETLKDLPRCLHESVPQPESGITYAPRVTSSLAAIKWQNMETIKVYNLHRALIGKYALTTAWHGLPIKLLEPSLLPGTCERERRTSSTAPLNVPGCIELDRTGRVLRVLCADKQWIGFGAVGVPGKRPMSPRDFYNGYISKRSVTERTFT